MQQTSFLFYGRKKIINQEKQPKKGYDLVPRLLLPFPFR